MASRRDNDTSFTTPVKPTTRSIPVSNVCSPIPSTYRVPVTVRRGLTPSNPPLVRATGQSQTATITATMV